MEEKIKQLQSILRERLPAIRKWKRVSVFMYGDKMPKIIEDTNIVDSEHFFVYWNGIKSKHIHREEIKRVPLSDIDDLIRRNTERLKSERPIYK